MSRLTSREIREASYFCDKYPPLYEAILNRTVGTLNVCAIYQMADNYRVTATIYQSSFQFRAYFHLSDAIGEINEDNVLFKVAELEIFILFDDIKEYKSFMERVYGATIPGSLMDPIYKIYPFSPYQIVLLNQKQKIVLKAFGDDDSIQAVIEYCQELFKCGTITKQMDNYKEITVQTMVDNFQEVRNSVEKLNDYLGKNSGTKNVKNVNIVAPRPEVAGNMNYTSSFIGNSIYPEMPGYDVVSILKSKLVDPVNIIVVNGNNATINLNSGNSITNTTNIIKENKNSSEKLTKEWIIKNAPKDGDSTTETFDKYKLEMKGQSLSLKKFTAAMREAGYENIRRNGPTHKWYKK